MATLLELRDVDTFYGEIHILQRVSLEVAEGELVCLLGGNASGKSTTLKTILGIVRPRAGTIEFAGEDVTERPTSYRIAKGMAIVPENRRLFAPMTVQENLEMGAYLRKDGAGSKEAFERVYELFPLLKERRRQLAGTLSGGEQQMVAIGRSPIASATASRSSRSAPISTAARREPSQTQSATRTGSTSRTGTRGEPPGTIGWRRPSRRAPRSRGS